MSGALFIQALRDSGAVLLPIDSEHNAIFQCLPTDYSQGLGTVGVRRILLTASGGPFRNGARPSERCDSRAGVRSSQLVHGAKDLGGFSEHDEQGAPVIEACWLFDARPHQVEVVIHPQSVIHSMVDYVDGSVLAQLGESGHAHADRACAGLAGAD